MKNYFYKLADLAVSKTKAGEFIYLNLSGEESDFIRLNHALIRQNGHVSQYYLSITLIFGGKQAHHSLSLSKNFETDSMSVDNALNSLRNIVSQVEIDPYILYSTEVNSTETVLKNELPESENVVNEIIALAKGLDLVGIFAGGNIIAGFANSAGQKNWFEKPGFNFSWSVYHSTDKAVKSGYAGYKWDESRFNAKMEKVRTELEIMKRTPVTIQRGKYRVYLAPSALEDFFGVIGWGGFGIKSQKTKNSSLIKLVENEVTLNEAVTVTENTLEGSSPNFNSTGFIKPDVVKLIEKGKHAGSLVSPRSSKEYGEIQNGANGYEMPESLEMNGGNIVATDILKVLDTGIYLNNVHYLNYSDRASCKVTGMSRFAAFYVKNGEITAPINVMRFDESVFKMFGENFVDATSEREMLISTDTYGQRSTESSHLPGIIVKDFSFTL
ncbi:MAG TPA: metallopeptidase TldD-related protein [bacterium]|nr:metallopeptidase TldD-related protein [bacterium]HRQ69640.1 metallopeptidase TldD-related protein [bacterium]